MITSIAHQQYNNNDGWEEEDISGMMMDYQLAVAAGDQYNDEQQDNAADGGGDYNNINQQQWSSTNNNDNNNVQYHNLLDEEYYHNNNDDNAQRDTRHYQNNNLNMNMYQEEDNNYTEENNYSIDEEVDRNRQQLSSSGINNNYNNAQYNQQTAYSYQDENEDSHEYDAEKDHNMNEENENKRKGGCVTNSMNNRTHYQPRQWHDDSEYSYNNNNKDEESVNQRQQEQCNNSREEEDQQSYYENVEYCQQDNNYNTEAAEEREEGEGWHYDGIEFNQIQRPPTMFNNNQEDNNYYDADDEHIQHQQDEVPREVSFVPGQDDSQEYDDDQSLDYSQQKHHNSDDLVYSDDDSSIDSNNNSEKYHQQPIFRGTSESLDVIHRIESVMESLLKYLDKKEAPVLRGYAQSRSNNSLDDCDDSVEEDDPDAFQPTYNTLGDGDPKFHRSFGNIAQSRSFTSICLVMSFIHQLLLYNRTTTTREVYYVFVTHFRNQRECDGVILDVAKILGVSRRSLGLSASPKGWFCGCVEITRVGTLPSSGKDVSGCIDGTALSSIQGLPITKEWTERDSSTGCTTDGVEIKISSKDAKVILVIEKEGVYNRLSEERIFDRFPCILVTGKGFPDLATRALVSTLHNELELPVIGLCDCNPYGISVLSLYHCAGERMGVDGRMRYSVPIQWLGLRPSEVARLKDDLPETVFQKLTDLDKKRMTSLLDPNHEFLSEEDEEEVRDMEDAGYKVELEALYWLGPDYMGNWVVNMLRNEYDNDNNGGGDKEGSDDEDIECRNVAEESDDDF